MQLVQYRGSGVGADVGFSVVGGTVGVEVGVTVGFVNVGGIVGKDVGFRVGVDVTGETLGPNVGSSVGLGVGNLVGIWVGLELGFDEVGSIDGLAAASRSPVEMESPGHDETLLGRERLLKRTPGRGGESRLRPARLAAHRCRSAYRPPSGC